MRIGDTIKRLLYTKHSLSAKLAFSCAGLAVLSLTLALISGTVQKVEWATLFILCFWALLGVGLFCAVWTWVRKMQQDE